MAAPLLTTKLYVSRVPPEFVPRLRLTNQLSVGLDRKLMFISAPLDLYGRRGLAQRIVDLIATPHTRS